MFHLKCTIKFPDGKTVVAMASARRRGDYVPVTYSGDVERLRYRPAKAEVMGMRYLLECAAKDAGAEFQDESEGFLSAK